MRIYLDISSNLTQAIEYQFTIFSSLENITCLECSTKQVKDGKPFGIAFRSRQMRNAYQLPTSRPAKYDLRASDENVICV